VNVVARQPQLFGIEHVLREVGDLLSDRKQGRRWNDDLELRNQNPFPPCAIPDADIPAPGILLQHIVDVVSGYFAQHFRWESMNSHGFERSPENPPHASREQDCNRFADLRKLQSEHNLVFFAHVKTRAEHSSAREQA
jgi:hypothetical protein